MFGKRDDCLGHFEQMALLLRGTSGDAWNAIDHNQSQMRDFGKAVRDFGLWYMSEDPRRQQIRFLRRRLVKPLAWTMRGSST